jgi:NAD(P)-dependent dehydrogenase (short-subunit alcohol dehydrogenase family)
MADLLQKLETPRAAMIQGASRGIGLELVRQLLEKRGFDAVIATSRYPEKSDGLRELERDHTASLYAVALDVTDEDSVRRARREVGSIVESLDLIFNVAGLLHDDATGLTPEKSLRDIDPANLARSFAVNATGPILVAKHFADLIPRKAPAVFANMSARVGSIGDNYKGGWYAYRASKAAQNQLTRTLSIELGRRAKGAIGVALHPGTVDTDLSEPFQARVPADRLFSVQRAASQLLDVIDGLNPEDTGCFFDWAGEPIEW